MLPARNSGAVGTYVSVGGPTQATLPIVTPTVTTNPARHARAPLSEAELTARFTSGYEKTHERAIEVGGMLGLYDEEAEDLFQTVVFDLWGRWSDAKNPEPFPGRRHALLQHGAPGPALAGREKRGQGRARRDGDQQVRRGITGHVPEVRCSSDMVDEYWEDVDDGGYFERLGSDDPDLAALEIQKKQQE